jgi:hypothetical protein
MIDRLHKVGKDREHLSVSGRLPDIRLRPEIDRLNNNYGFDFGDHRTWRRRCLDYNWDNRRRWGRRIDYAWTRRRRWWRWWWRWRIDQRWGGLLGRCSHCDGRAWGRNLDRGRDFDDRSDCFVT